MKLLVTGLLLLAGPAGAYAWAQPDWSEHASLPAQGRANPYEFSEADFPVVRDAGKIHTQIYPVETTGMLPPYQPTKKILEDTSKNPLRRWINEILQDVSGFESMDDFLKDLGLHPYPKASDQGLYAVPYPNGQRPEYRMGLSLIQRPEGLGFSFSCAACHSSNLFGKTVLGMTNRFPKANEFFVQAQKASKVLSPTMFQFYTKATDGETEMLRRLKQNMKYLGLKKPVALGLDTSLAQVSLSLNHRNEDAYATYSDHYAKYPRPDAILDSSPADSKPAVWWNLKYKNRWLSDGSVVSGNPILTNILWNEIGRGSDLRELETWFRDNEKTLQELTTAVFSSEAPRFTDFFPAEKIDLKLAQQGEGLFNNTCARCHGHYDKAWSLPNADQLSPAEKLKTTLVRYKDQTPVIDVGTDPYRYRGMKSLEQLNKLAISQNNGIRIEAQKGYVPPPLVGVWARWPYFHNNSAPSLCAVLSAQKNRPVTYYSGEANDTTKDFDSDCNGYPLEDRTPAAWKTAKHHYDTRNPGMGNQGHDEKIFLENGKELFSPQQKRALIQFLQTL